MPPLHTIAYQGCSPQSQNGMEWGQIEEVLLSVALPFIYTVFVLLLILHTGREILMDVLQQRDASQPHLSVEETSPHLSLYVPVYH